MIPIPLVCKLVAATLSAASPGGISEPIGIPALSAEAVQVAGTGTVVGEVIFEGIVPPKRRIVPRTEHEVCGEMRGEDRIVLSPERGVQGAVVYLKHVDKGKTWPKPASLPKIENTHFGFRPRVQVVPVVEIDLVNSDPIPHRVYVMRDRVAVFEVDLEKHRRTTKSLDEPGP